MYTGTAPRMLDQPWERGCAKHSAVKGGFILDAYTIYKYWIYMLFILDIYWMYMGSIGYLMDILDQLRSP